MRKIYASILGLTLLSITVSSQTVDQATAAQTAINFLTERAALSGAKSAFGIGQIAPLSFEGRTAFYAVDCLPQGFVLLSSSRNSYPVVAFSFEESFNPGNMSPAQEIWLKVAALNVLQSETSVANPGAQAQWNKYSSPHFTVPQAIKTGKQVLPLNNIKWNQNDPYNSLCPPHPSGPGGNCYAGCVATAMGMVMKHWNYPPSGSGSKTYFWGNYYTVHFDSTQYDWPVMTNTINATSKNAIAELLFHAGISVNMNYSPTGSGASTYTAANSLKQYFEYIPTLEIYEKISMSDYNWKFMLKQEIDFGRPVLYSGHDSTFSGHAFVLDGYQDTMFWHFNWGWGGYGNGYFNLNYGDPKPLSFVFNQEAIMGIQPPTAAMCNSIEYTQDHWTFDDGSGTSYYQNNRSCDYTLKPANGGPVSLSFLSFNTEVAQDVLYIYDGENAAAPLIGTYSGNQLPSTIVSSGDALFLRFETNGSIQNPGWKAAYHSLAMGVASSIFEQTLTLFPNPASEQVNVSFFASEASNYRVKVQDLSGREVLQTIGTCDVGNNLFILQVNDLTPGCYLISLVLDDRRISGKILRK